MKTCIHDKKTKVKNEKINKINKKQFSESSMIVCENYQQVFIDNNNDPTKSNTTRDNYLEYQAHMCR